MNPQISLAQAQQLDELLYISRLTFTEAFAPDNQPENLQQYLTSAFTHCQLGKELKNPNSEFYLAFVEGQIAGYLKLNYNEAQTEFKELQGVEIERIYVAARYYGKQLGQLLLNQALQCAFARNARYIWLGVWEKNHRAIRFYQKNGFQTLGTHPFMMGNELQTDWLMRLPLS